MSAQARWETAPQRSRRAVVAFAGSPRPNDRPVRARAESLRELGIEVTYLGREENADRIAAAVVADHADAVELCVAGAGGVLLLRALLCELTALGRRDVRIVVHRVS